MSAASPSCCCCSCCNVHSLHLRRPLNLEATQRSSSWRRRCCRRGFGIMAVDNTGGRVRETRTFVKPPKMERRRTRGSSRRARSMLISSSEEKILSQVSFLPFAAMLGNSWLASSWWWPLGKRDWSSVTSFFTADRAPFLHCILKLGTRNPGSRIPKSMDSVSPVACLPDFWKNFCCDSVAGGARFAGDKQWWGCNIGKP